MKEYEYIIKAMEGYLCHQLTGVICSENYRDRSYDIGYMTIFKEYWSLHEEYNKNRVRLEAPTLEEGAVREFEAHCQKKQEEIWKRFFTDMQACIKDTSFDLTESREYYLCELEKEDAKTLAKRVCLYPYLVSVMRRHHREERENDGLEVQ